MKGTFRTLNDLKVPFRTSPSGRKVPFTAGAQRPAHAAGQTHRTHRINDTDGMTIGGFRFNA
jgi:hypothetical protein